MSEISAEDLRPAKVRRDWRPDLLAGGPPCQPFSSSGAQKSVLDSRGLLFEHFARLAAELNPRFVLFENVRGLVTARGPSGTPGEALVLVKEAFESVGFATTFAVLNSADFGVPQRRVRLFMVGTREFELPKTPRPTHARHHQPSLFDDIQPWVSLREFLATRREPEPGEVVRPTDRLLQLLQGVPEGSGLKSPGRKEPTRPGGHWGYKQGTFIADLALPARTVTAASTQDWIREPGGQLRRLTLAECAALQGFPDDWRFCGSKTSQFRQVGNAVPARLGEVLGAAIRSCLRAGRSHRKSRTESAPLPAHMDAAIAYTIRDHERNKSSRVRARVFTRAKR